VFCAICLSYDHPEDGHVEWKYAGQKNTGSDPYLCVYSVSF
jgi:hypothetical protein